MDADIPDAEISRYMDFDSVLAKRKLALMRLQYWMGGAALVGLLLVSLTAWYFLGSDRQTNIAPAGVAEEKNQIPDSSLLLEQSNTVDFAPDEKTTRSIRKEEHNVTSNDDVQVSEEKSNKQSLNVDQIYLPAEPLDGYSALYNYFNTNLVYPPEAIKDSVQGTLVINFTINRAGEAEDIQITQSLGALFEKEAHRLIENMPVWKPASLNGKPVSSKVSLPLHFQKMVAQSE